MQVFQLLSNILAMTLLPKPSPNWNEERDRGWESDQQQKQLRKFGFGGLLLSEYELPEVEMSVEEIVEYYGYPIQTHEVTTDDGYILTMHRIPYGKSEKPSPRSRPVVFLQHGLLGSSADWVTNLPTQSAAFVFADAGFDVWMGNVRGNIYSRAHRSISPKSNDYWKFSWDEMAAYDLPTMVERALNISGLPYLYYVGHSQGTEIMFAKLASDDSSHFAWRIRKFYALAPVSTVGDIKGLFAWIGRNFGEFPSVMKLMFGAGEFLPYSWLIQYFSRLICGEPFGNPLCRNVLFQIGGPESNQFNSSRLSVYLAHVPAGTSTQNIIHWAQMVRSKTMQKYDYGPIGNEKVYGQLTPPVYNLSTIATPMYLFHSDDDWLSNPADVQLLLTQLPRKWVYVDKKLNSYNHFDYIWGERAASEIYHPIIDDILGYPRHEKRGKKE